MPLIGGVERPAVEEALPVGGRVHVGGIVGIQGAGRRQRRGEADHAAKALAAVFGGRRGRGDEEIMQRRNLAAVLLRGDALGRQRPARTFSAIRSIIKRSMNGSFMVMKVSTRSPSAVNMVAAYSVNQPMTSRL